MDGVQVQDRLLGLGWLAGFLDTGGQRLRSWTLCWCKGGDVRFVCTCISGSNAESVDTLLAFLVYSRSGKQTERHEYNSHHRW